MSLIVQKFGGTSVGSLELIRQVADRVIKSKKEGHDMVIVLSAMSGETDRLLNLAREMTPQPDLREVDVLISTGEQVSVALFCLACQAQGFEARSLLGFQARIVTDHLYGKAHITNIDSTRIRHQLDRGRIVAVAGFQGLDERGDITTLGRGGSDTTAVALAGALGADICEIFTDVKGVYTTDPNICPQARQRLHQQSSSSHSICVKIAIDGDPFLAPDGPDQHVHRPWHIAHGKDIGSRPATRQEICHIRRIPYLPIIEHLHQHRRQGWETTEMRTRGPGSDPPRFERHGHQYLPQRR